VVKTRNERAYPRPHIPLPFFSAARCAFCARSFARPDFLVLRFLAGGAPPPGGIETGGVVPPDVGGGTTGGFGYVGVEGCDVGMCCNDGVRDNALGPGEATGDPAGLPLDDGAALEAGVVEVASGSSFLTSAAREDCLLVRATERAGGKRAGWGWGRRNFEPHAVQRGDLRRR
jgi:hypothetical protein